MPVASPDGIPNVLNPNIRCDDPNGHGYFEDLASSLAIGYRLNFYHGRRDFSIAPSAESGGGV